MALINNVRRTLAVRASAANTQLLSLTRGTFTRILGSIKQYLKEDYKKANGVNTSQTGGSVDGSFLTDNQEHSANNSILSA